jgi:hypothetical protein
LNMRSYWRIVDHSGNEAVVGGCLLQLSLSNSEKR